MSHSHTLCSLRFSSLLLLLGRQETLPDGGCVVRFVNGDLKRVEGGTGVVVYTYAAARTTHTMHPSGLEVFEFPNGQVGGCFLRV